MAPTDICLGTCHRSMGALALATDLWVPWHLPQIYGCNSHPDVAQGKKGNKSQNERHCLRVCRKSWMSRSENRRRPQGRRLPRSVRIGRPRCFRIFLLLVFFCIFDLLTRASPSCMGFRTSGTTLEHVYSTRSTLSRGITISGHSYVTC